MEAHHPTTLEEALEILSSHPDATLLAGGTDLMVEVNYGGRSPTRVVGLRRVTELASWDGGLIGAGVTYRRMERGPVVALAQAARTVGSPQIRNAGTIGGNVATASPAGDTLPVLAALDASILLRDSTSDRELPWDEFITGVKKTAMRPGELITGVRLPDVIPGRQAFAKIGVRNAMVISITSCALFRWDDGTTRVALGSVGPTPIRARRAEAMISAETNPSENALTEFARLVEEEVRPISDHRSTAEYRRHASGVLARRCLERVL